MVSQQFTRGLSQANPLLLIYPRGIHPSQEFLQFCVWFSTAFSRTPEISRDMQFTRVFGQKRWFPLLRRMKVVKLHRWTEFACVDALSTWVGPTSARGPRWVPGSRPILSPFGPTRGPFWPVRGPFSPCVCLLATWSFQPASCGRKWPYFGPSGARFRSICPLLSVPLPSTDLPVSTTRFRDVVRRIRGGVRQSRVPAVAELMCFPKITPLGSLT